MQFDLGKLEYDFLNKPLLVGGEAKEYYGIRKNNHDIDFVVTKEDYERLAKKYPNNLTDIWGDLGIHIYGFDLLKTLTLFDYDFLSKGSTDNGTYKIISIEKLLFTIALAMKKSKYAKDLELIVDKVLEMQYKNIDVSKYLKPNKI